ncbi:hypothetical protein B0H14DRAFT_3429759 [Mycena olivaceomarginata]|nr:hypothetical protein B0H14DRAFT_3429759 [Mycena olivaceomarginata]
MDIDGACFSDILQSTDCIHYASFKASASVTNSAAQRVPGSENELEDRAPRPPPNAVNRSNANRNGTRRGPARTQLFVAARQAYRDPESRHDLGRMDDVCSDCGALHWEAEKVVKPPKDASPYGVCCNHGKVSLNRLNEPPQPLHRLLVGGDAQAQEFRTHITQYNADDACQTL